MRFTRKVFINRTSDVVLGYLASTANEPHWRARILHNGADEQGLLGIGATGRSLRFMGRDVDVRWKIVEFEHQARLCREYMSRVRGGRDRYTLRPFGLGSTVVNVEIEVDTTGLIGLLSASRRTSTEHELRTDRQRLKRYVEES